MQCTEKDVLKSTEATTRMIFSVNRTQSLTCQSVMGQCVRWYFAFNHSCVVIIPDDYVLARHFTVHSTCISSNLTVHVDICV